MNSFIGILALAVLSLLLVFVVAMLYLTVGIFAGMHHVVNREEYDIFDFFGVMLFWPEYIYKRLRGVPWK